MKEYIVQAYAEETIKTFEEHNAPELVRCKDCGIGEKTLNVYRKGETWCFKQEKYHPDDWFCADGIPKEGGGHEES